MALFADVARLAEDLAREGSRLKKRAAIAAATGALASDTAQPDPHIEAGRFCLYLAGQPFPEADARNLNAGGAILSRALKTVSGATDAAMTAAYRRHGDLGAAAYDLLAPPYGKAPASPTIALAQVAGAFDTMATARTTAARASTVETLLRRATPLEAKYLLKLMLGDMRIGVKQSLIEEGIAVAAEVSVEAVRHAVMLEADLQRAVIRAFEGTLAEARMTLFHPLGFMLASPVETPEEAVERFTAKPKKTPAPKPPARKRSKKGAEGTEPGDLAAILPANSAEAAYADDIALEANENASSGAEAPGTIHAFLEDKFDGIRAQLHCGDPAQPGRVAVYSRSREDITEAFPELAEAFATVTASPGGLIVDGEILGWDTAAGKALPFAILGQRIGRKRVTDDIRRSIPVVFMAFDLMFAAGDLQLPRPLRERRALLEQITADLQGQTRSSLEAPNDQTQGHLFHGTTPGVLDFGVPGEPSRQGERPASGAGNDDRNAPIQRFLLSRTEMVTSAESVDQGYRDARARANEGVMLKAADSAYLPGRRGLAWLKLKRELATFDVVITGAEFGSGKRAQSLSDYTFAIRGPAGDLLNLGKAYQGVTDAEIAELTEWCKAHTLEDHGHFRTVEPLRVLEVAFNNIMRSDRHASGFALRFPRILRVRDDKPVSEIDTLARVEEVYGTQPDKPADANR